MTVGLINTSYLNILNSIFWDNDSNYEFASMPNNNHLIIEGAYSLFEYQLEGENNIASYHVTEKPVNMQPHAITVFRGIPPIIFMLTH